MCRHRLCQHFIRPSGSNHVADGRHNLRRILARQRRWLCHHEQNCHRYPRQNLQAGGGSVRMRQNPQPRLCHRHLLNTAQPSSHKSPQREGASVLHPVCGQACLTRIRRNDIITLSIRILQNTPFFDLLVHKQQTNLGG